MRGIVSGGTLAALFERNLVRCFDTIYGVSAGTFSAVYTACDRVEAGKDVYLRYLNTFNFFSVGNLLAGDLINVHYLMETVKATLTAKDIAKLGGFSPQVRTVLYEVPKAHLMSCPLTGEYNNAMALLEASATIAGCVGMRNGGTRFIDAAPVDPTGLRTVFRDGHTHAVVLLSRPRRAKLRTHGFLEDALLGPRLRQWPPYVRKLIRDRARVHEETMIWLAGLTRHSAVFVVEPNRLVSTFELRRTRLQSAFDMGYDAGMRAADEWVGSGDQHVVSPLDSEGYRHRGSG